MARLALAAALALAACAAVPQDRDGVQEAGDPGYLQDDWKVPAELRQQDPARPASLVPS